MRIEAPEARVRKTKRAEYDARRIDAAFARAALEEAELRRLKAQHPQYSGLYFRPELIGSEAVADDARDTAALTTER